jgi:hypothetical protein
VGEPALSGLVSPQSPMGSSVRLPEKTLRMFASRDASSCGLGGRSACLRGDFPVLIEELDNQTQHCEVVRV